MNFRFGRVGNRSELKGNGAPFALRWLVISLAGSVGYFFATKLGFEFKFPPYPVSVFWPANAIVLSVLLLTPVRVWPLVLLFIFPAHVAAQARDHAPWPLLLSWFVSNSFESVLGAAVTRMFTGDRVQFYRLRDICIFYLGGALFSVSVSSFIDSAFVELHNPGQNDYWVIWSIRFFSNFFASVTVVPVIVTWSTSHSLAFSKKNLEAALLIVALAGVSFVSFYQLYGGIEMLPVRLCLPLPLFIWAAVRFGVRGVSSAILSVAVFATWTSVHNRSPSTSGSSVEHALSIQTFFVLLSVILVPMAAVFDEKKAISEALRTSEERYRTVVETQSDLLCRCLADTTLTFVNESWCRFFNQSREQLIGKKILDLVPSMRHERLLRNFATSMVRRRPLLWEGEALLPDRNVGWQQWIINPIISDDGQIREIQAVGRDITKRKLAEEALRQSEQRYRGVVEAQSDLVSRYLPDSTLIFANQAFCNFFGTSREQLIGRKLTDILPPEAHAKFLESIKPTHSPQQPFVWDSALRGADGNVYWHQWNSCALTNSAGDITAIQAVGRDITSRKQAEEAQHKLAHVSRLATIGELTAIIVHEVSQPLSAILTNIAAGEKLVQLKPPPTDELLAVFSDIRHDNSRAVEAVRRVRAFSRKTEIEKRVVYLNALIEDVLRLLSGEMMRRHIKVHARLDADLPTVLGDELGLQQVFLNLAANAVDAVSEVPEPERFIWITAVRKDEQVLVSVKDSGRGIRTEFFDRVFESFFTTKREGLGLGLYISRSIIQAHGGYLWAENNKDRGAIFCFTLPLKAPVEPSKIDPRHPKTAVSQIKDPPSW